MEHYAWQIVITLLGGVISFLFASINHRLKGLDELKKELKEFKNKAYDKFVSYDACNLERKACSIHSIKKEQPSHV